MIVICVCLEWLRCLFRWVVSCSLVILLLMMMMCVGVVMDKLLCDE